MVYFKNDFLLKIYFSVTFECVLSLQLFKIVCFPQMYLTKCCCMSHVITHLWNFFNDCTTLLIQVQVSNTSCYKSKYYHGFNIIQLGASTGIYGAFTTTQHIAPSHINNVSSIHNNHI